MVILIPIAEILEEILTIRSLQHRYLFLGAGVIVINKIVTLDVGELINERLKAILAICLKHESYHHMTICIVVVSGGTILAGVYLGIDLRSVIRRDLIQITNVITAVKNVSLNTGVCFKGMSGIYCQAFCKSCGKLPQVSFKDDMREFMSKFVI